MSDPAAGSDLQGLRTRAVRDAKDLNGFRVGRIRCRSPATDVSIKSTSQIFTDLTLLTRPESHNNTGMRGLFSKLFAVPLGLVLLAMAACGGSAVVTLTATPSSDTFLAYRVGLVSVQLQKSNGKSALMVLPTETTVDLTKLIDLSEVLGAPAIAKGTYASAVITLDYSAAQIIYDDGSLGGVALSPVSTNGRALLQVVVTVTLDPRAPLQIAAKHVSRLALDIDLAASNAVNLNARTVTITPLMAASTLPIDTKQVRIRGPILGANSTFYAAGVMPFDGSVPGLGQLAIEPSVTTAYEINGFVSTGSAGQAQLAALPAKTLSIAFGTLTASATAATAGTTPAATGATVSSFTAAQVLVDGVQSFNQDHVSGIVSARSGNTLGIEDATVVQNGGTATLIPGTTIVNVGANTLVTFFGPGVAEVVSPQQISVGSSIEVFGTAGNTGSGAIAVDASAGRVRLDLTTAAGFVTAQGAGALTLNLTALGGRAVSGLDFVGSGAAANRYSVATGSLDLTNSIVGAPVIASGFPNAFATASRNFTATALFDPTTIQAELVVDWAGGTATPFTVAHSVIDLDVHNASIGPRHQIQIGSQVVDVATLSSNPMISPNTIGSTTVFSIGHSVSSTVESFNTYDAFIAQLQNELSSARATGMTAVGQYTVSTFAFSATSITLFLND